MTSPKIKNMTIKVYVTEEEKKNAAQKAANLNLSLSDFLRRSAINIPLPNIAIVNATLALIKINADLARFGNLIKMTLANSDTPLTPETRKLLEKSFKENEDVRAILKAKILSL